MITLVFKLLTDPVKLLLGLGYCCVICSQHASMIMHFLRALCEQGLPMIRIFDGHFLFFSMEDIFLSSLHAFDMVQSFSFVLLEILKL